MCFLAREHRNLTNGRTARFIVDVAHPPIVSFIIICVSRTIKFIYKLQYDHVVMSFKVFLNKVLSR